jgi:tRNA threonylcarbamoyladenosine biosynthesis protein TsaB
MTIASLDTSSDVLSVAIEHEGRRYQTTLDVGLHHSEFVLPVFDALIAVSGTRQAPFDLVVCMKGPGSFTGLRIGMATAKGLSQGYHCPFISVPTLDVLAEDHSEFDGTVVAVLDAKKKRVFAALYDHGERRSEYLDIEPARLPPLLDGDAPVLLVGPGAELARPALAQRAHVSVDTRWKSGLALTLLDLGRRAFERSGGDPIDAGPLYLRDSEAQLGRSEKLV